PRRFAISGCRYSPDKVSVGNLVPMSDFPCDFRDSARVEKIIDKLASTPRLFVVSDFDGTLAEPSTDIYGVPVNQDSIAALSAFAKLPDTFAAALSERQLLGFSHDFTLHTTV